MTRRAVPIFLSGLLALLGVGADGAAAQKGASNASGTVLAEFQAAQALGIDPRGRLYVVDAARDVVAVLDSEGKRTMVLGGSGTRPGEFDTPSDVDPTNGQLILVADTYNGRIQRFSAEGQYLESLPIGSTDRAPAGTWRFEDGRNGDPVRGDGRPIAVARDDEGTLFVIDERTRQLLRWNDLGQAERLTGARQGRLQKPVALAVGDGRRVYVADTERGAVFVYDAFGTFRRRVPVDPLPGVRALTVHRGRLFIVCADRVLVWTHEKGLVAEHSVDRSEPLVDAAFDEHRAYLLTATRLLRRSDW